MAKITSHDENSKDAHLVLVRVANDQNVAMILCKVLDGLVVISNVGYKDRVFQGLTSMPSCLVACTSGGGGGSSVRLKSASHLARSSATPSGVLLRWINIMVFKSAISLAYL